MITPFITEPADLHPGMLVMTTLRNMAQTRAWDWRVTLVTEENAPWLLRAYVVDPRVPRTRKGDTPNVPTWEQLKARVEHFGQ